jgi:hypothetical protein
MLVFTRSSGSEGAVVAAVPVHLGHGYSAQVVARDRLEGSTIAIRTLTLRRGGTVLQRFTFQDDALPLAAIDITGDGVRDVLAWNYTDGSGGCGSYRLYAGRRLREVYVRRDCLDTFTARLTREGLITWRAIGSSKMSQSIHCCYLRWLRTTRRWVHGHLAIVSRGVVPNTSLPPPAPIR